MVMAVAWLILPFIPASNIFFPVGFVVAERILYLPSMGFSLIVSIGFHRSFFSSLYQELVFLTKWLRQILPTLLLHNYTQGVQSLQEWPSEKCSPWGGSSSFAHPLPEDNLKVIEFFQQLFFSY